jgi:hypothetical protein
MFRNRGKAFAYSSIVGLVKGETSAPFVIAPLSDLTNLLATALPPAFWDRSFQEHRGHALDARLTVGRFSGVISRDYPILISGT